jgi:transcriptional regulator with XRE-family HTH domain
LKTKAAAAVPFGLYPPPLDLATLGEAYRDQRAHLQWSQEECATRLCLSKKQVIALELGSSTVFLSYTVRYWCMHRYASLLELDWECLQKTHALGTPVADADAATCALATQASSVVPTETEPIFAPDATAPEATTPEATAPEATAPEATAPEATAPAAPPGAAALAAEAEPDLAPRPRNPLPRLAALLVALTLSIAFAFAFASEDEQRAHAHPTSLHRVICDAAAFVAWGAARQSCLPLPPRASDTPSLE